MVAEAGNQTLVGEVPASFLIDSYTSYNNTKRYRIKQSEEKYVRLIYSVPSFNLLKKRETKSK